MKTLSSRPRSKKTVFQMVQRIGGSGFLDKKLCFFVGQASFMVKSNVNNTTRKTVIR